MTTRRRIKRASLLLTIGVVGGVLFGAERPVDAHMSPLVCPVKQQRCDGKCVGKTPANGCGDKQCRPCALAGAVRTCETVKDESICGYERCQDGYLDLDGDRVNGCEAIAVNVLWFEIPTTYHRTAVDGVVQYDLIDVAPGSMSKLGERHPTSKRIYLKIPAGPALTEIDRCFALAAALPATTPVWLEMFAKSGGPLLYQRPTNNNYAPFFPPNYTTADLELRADLTPSIACHVNAKPFSL